MRNSVVVLNTITSINSLKIKEVSPPPPRPRGERRDIEEDRGCLLPWTVDEGDVGMWRWRDEKQIAEKETRAAPHGHLLSFCFSW